ncbi:MAG TPA: DUF4276 family protein [Anaerohalosphaeraceae bacterium]|nr:DUF4276 family protein [Anaerohalosphaeraceae bacterium]
MSNIEVYIIVEGQTEQTFIRDILAPEMSYTGIFLYPTLLGKPGHKGGKIQFDRAQKDIEKHLKQRNNTYVSTMFDFFRIDADWPGKREISDVTNSGRYLPAIDKARIVENATYNTINDIFSDYLPAQRFIPYIEMHEFEALLFSNASILASIIGVEESQINLILDEHGEPEEINDGPETAPSKRLMNLKHDYRKVAMGKTISEAIGVQAMRDKCKHFNAWLTKIEQLA